MSKIPKKCKPAQPALPVKLRRLIERHPTAWKRFLVAADALAEEGDELTIEDWSEFVAAFDYLRRVGFCFDRQFATTVDVANKKLRTLASDNDQLEPDEGFEGEWTDDEPFFAGTTVRAPGWIPIDQNAARSLRILLQNQRRQAVPAELVCVTDEGDFYLEGRGFRIGGPPYPARRPSRANEVD